MEFCRIVVTLTHSDFGGGISYAQPNLELFHSTFSVADCQNEVYDCSELFEM